MKVTHEFIKSAMEHAASLGGDDGGDAAGLGSNPLVITMAAHIDHQLRDVPPMLRVSSALVIGMELGAREAERSTLTGVLDGIERASQ